MRSSSSGPRQCDQGRQVPYLEVRPGIGNRGGPGARLAVAPVDPDRLEAELFGRYMVVKEDLGHVQDLLRGQTNARHDFPKVIGGCVIALVVLRSRVRL